MANLDKMEKDELIALVKQLQRRKKYGLVWEEKTEDVVEQCKKELPVLEEDSKRAIEKDKDGPTNIIIEGDNYHALSVLNYTHTGKVDVIYIDPPYNTGAKDWKYNNHYVDESDTYQHSKWICMMYHRLKLAKKLLAQDGFLICAIDEYEIHNVRHLLDEIFGEDNKLGTVTVLHNPKGRNLSKFFSANSEFMLVYARNVDKAKFNSVAIDEEVLASFDETDEDGRFRLEPFMRVRTSWSRKNKPKNFYPIYVSKDLKEITLSAKKNYFEIYPKTKDGREWAWKNIPSSFSELNKGDYFQAQKENGEITIYHKYREQQVFKNVWTNKKYQSEFNGTNLLKKILGGNVFNYPKSLYLVADILKITTSKNSLVLDFFAGSGTTGHAVMMLNKDDGGNRKFILCTNNENGIAEEVTYPRIKNVINGYSDTKGIPANLRYFKTEFVSKSKVSDDTRRELVKRSTEMICVRENTFDKIVDHKNFKIYKNNNHATGILFELDAISEFKEKIGKQKLPAHIYVFSLTNDTYDEDFDDLELKHELCPIPESILEVYRKLFKE